MIKTHYTKLDILRHKLKTNKEVKAKFTLEELKQIEGYI